MKQLLALLDCGTHGTQAEPLNIPHGPQGKLAHVQHLTAAGTLRTPGTYQAAAFDALAQRVADLADAYRERIAIVLEAGDIGEADARRIAEAEVGWLFVEAFIPGEAAA
jgi:hypothetical protein